MEDATGAPMIVLHTPVTTTRGPRGRHEMPMHNFGWCLFPLRKDARLVYDGWRDGWMDAILMISRQDADACLATHPRLATATHAGSQAGTTTLVNIVVHGIR